MSQKILNRAHRGVAACLLLTSGLVSVPAAAQVTITPINADISSMPFDFSFMGGQFTFDGSGGIFSPLSVQTNGSAAVRTVFGGPSTDFTNRGTVVFDASTLGGFGSFPTLTNIPFSNGENFLGLRVTSGGQDFFGFAFTTNSTLNSIGFESRAGVGITATRAIPAAVPEPGTWALLILGFGAVGFALRRRKVHVAVGYA